MKRRQFVGLSFRALFVALAPTALASNTWYVNGVNGSDVNNCQSALTACKTIGHAISLASAGGSIIVAPAKYSENLTIGISLNLIGSSAGATIIDGGGAHTVITISRVGVVTLSHLTIRNGHAPYAGGIFNDGVLTLNNSTVSGNVADNGGGILNQGLLTINNSTISGNSAFTLILSRSYGGGIWNSGTLTINNSTLNGNGVGCGRMGCLGFGGAIENSGELFINNSTLAGNSAHSVLNFSYGGAIQNSSGIAKVSNSTFTGNIAARGANISGPVEIKNSIIANNWPSVRNCYGTMASDGYNLSSDNTCNLHGPGDLNNIDPKLGIFGYHGGPTQTIPLLAGSPAIDAGNPSGCTDVHGNLLKTDQRGMPRPDVEDKGGCDMGAYESQSDTP